MTEQAGRIESQLPEGSIHTMTTRHSELPVIPCSISSNPLSGSIRGPYGEGTPESNQFAFLNKVFSAPASAESYSPVLGQRLSDF